MLFREANIPDIKQMQVVRHAVKENRLSDPGLVPDEDYEVYLTLRGKGWVCEIENCIVGFAIADLQGHSIWALFVLPEFAGKGIGKRLHEVMLQWYFSQTKERVWLSTAPGTKAEMFYQMQGWMESGLQKNGEIRFEMKYDDWNRDATEKDH